MKVQLLFVFVLALVACAPVATNVTNNTTVFEPYVPVTPAEPVSTETPAEEEFAAHLTFTEGDRIELKTLAEDPDNDDVALSFSAPFSEDGEWQTEIGDAGDYPVTVIADDGREGGRTSQRILVTIQFANRAPTIQGPDSLEFAEGELIELDFTTSDADGDEVILSYGGWMKGATYQTTFDDAGEYEVLVIAEDGKLETRKEVPITITNVNRAPSIEFREESFTTVELIPVSVVPRVTDPDGDEVTVSYSEPLDNQGSWTPALDEAGTYTVEVTASDGDATTVQEVLLTVTPANRPPTIVVPTDNGELRVKEGDFIDLRNLLSITDKEGSEVLVTFSGWMRGPTYQTTFDDAGRHAVTVVATDDTKQSASLTFTIVVEDVNRPPVFTKPA